MALNNEDRLISALIRDADLRVAAERGVRTDWFLSDDARLVYGWLVEYHGKYGSFPSMATIRDNFPTYDIIAVTDPVEYFVDQLVDFHRHRTTVKTLKDAATDLAERDHESAIRTVHTGIEQLREYNPLPVFHTDLTSTVERRYDEYMSRRDKTSTLLGLSSGYPSLDSSTLGFQPEQLIVLVAPSKTGKSTVCMSICNHVHQTYNKTPLFISFEMSRRELELRHDAMRARIPLSGYLNGTLSSSDTEALADMLDDMESRVPYVLADSSEGATISAVRAKVDEVKPEFVVVDGVYLMVDEETGESGTPQALTNLTRGMKRLAQSTKLPIMLSTQALRSKMVRGRLGADSAGYSSSFSQDADVLLGLEELEDTPSARTLRVIMSRNSGPIEMMIDFDWDSGSFGEL